MTNGERFKRHLKSRKLSYSDVSVALKISRWTVYRLVNKSHDPRMETVRRLKMDPVNFDWDMGSK